MDLSQCISGFSKRLAAIFNRELNQEEFKERLISQISKCRENKILQDDSATMMEAILDLGETQVRDIMIPRGQMNVLNKNQSLDEILEMIFKSGHSRYPVFDEDLENTIGILIVKDLLSLLVKGDKDFLKVLRPAYFVPESKNLDSMLKDFKTRRNHMAIVMNEYGGISGLITIEDVIEEIVGEIDDEHDKIPDAEIRKIKANEFHINALMSIEHFNEEFKTTLSDAEADTIGGFVLGLFGKLPQVGESVMIDENLKITVLKANQRRLLTLKLNYL